MTDITTPEIKDTWTAPNGVVLKLKKVSRFVIVELGRKIPVPKPPMVYLEEKGRAEDNPNDPDYLASVQEANYQRSMLTITASLSLGTEILKLPDGMVGPENDEWLEILEALEISVPKDNKRLRYAAWLKYMAIPDDSFNELLTNVLKFSGLTTEQDVAAAQNAFRSETTGNGHLPTPITAQS